MTEALRGAPFLSAAAADGAFWEETATILHHMLTAPMADVVAQEALRPGS